MVVQENQAPGMDEHPAYGLAAWQGLEDWQDGHARGHALAPEDPYCGHDFVLVPATAWTGPGTGPGGDPRDPETGGSGEGAPELFVLGVLLPGQQLATLSFTLTGGDWMVTEPLPALLNREGQGPERCMARMA